MRREFQFAKEGDKMQPYGWSPFILRIQEEQIPQGFKLPTLETFDGSVNPKEHLASFRAQVTLCHTRCLDVSIVLDNASGNHSRMVLSPYLLFPYPHSTGLWSSSGRTLPMTNDWCVLWHRSWQSNKESSWPITSLDMKPRHIRWPCAPIDRLELHARSQPSQFIWSNVKVKISYSKQINKSLCGSMNHLYVVKISVYVVQRTTFPNLLQQANQHIAIQLLASSSKKDLRWKQVRDEELSRPQ